MNLAILLALGAAATWAIGMTIAKPGIRHLDRLSYMLIRWSIVAVLALLYGAIRGTLEFPSVWGVGMAALAGLLDAGAGGFFFLMAMQRTTAFRVTTLASTAPLWGVFASILLLDEALRWQAVAAAVLVVVGSMLLVERRRSRHSNSRAGALFALLTGLLFGVAETVPSKLALNAGVPPETLLLVFAVAGVVGILAILPFLRRRIPVHIEPRGLVFVSVSAIGGAFLGWLLWLNGLELAPASILSPIRGATLLFAFVYSILFLRESPSRRAYFGVFAVLAGVLLVSVMP